MNLRPVLVLPVTAIALLAFSSAATAGGPPVRHGTTFTDVSASLDFERVDESLTVKLGGQAWIDFDDDDDLDLYLVNAPGGDNALFRNDGGSFTNVAATAGVTGDGIGYTAALAGDIDNDGCTDLFLTGAGGFFGVSLPHRLYINNCDGSFRDATASSGIDPDHLGLMPAFGDIDRDGYLDLFVASPGDYVTGTLTTQKLYHNNGDGTFSDISASAGIDTALGGCVVGFSDFNHDWYPDILLGNCNNLDVSGPQSAPIVGPWELWINQGDLSFVDEAEERGLGDDPGFPMAVTLGDYDSDGDLDIFATGAGVADPFGGGSELSEQTLFQNQGDGTFIETTEVAGLGGYEFGWGASFADFDNDGDEDLATVGSVAVSFMQLLGPLGGPGRVYENDNGTMRATIDFGLEFQATSGLSVADYDGDGFVDLAIVKTAYDYEDTPFGPIAGDGAPVLLHNDGNSNNSLTLKLVGNESNAMGIGAKVKTFVGGGIGWEVKEVTAGSSFASTNSPWLTFGLGNQHFGWVVVYWPSGLREAWGVPYFGPTLNTLEEGTGYAF